MIIRLRRQDVRQRALLFLLLALFLVLLLWTLSGEDIQSAPFDPEDPLIPFDHPEALRFLIEPEKCSKSIETAVFILTRISEGLLRKEIRHSWAHPSNYDTSRMRIVFVVGNSTDKLVSEALRWENSEFGDMVQADVEEGYFHLSQKTLSGLEWTRRMCPSVKCTIKADSDNVVHLRNMEKLCQMHEKASIIGECNVTREVIRIPSKWIIPKYVYAPDQYPQYCSSGIYAYTGGISTVNRILKASSMSTYYTSLNTRMLPEDVLFTGIFADLANLSRINSPGFSFRANPNVFCERGLALIHSVHMNEYKKPERVWKILMELNGAICI